jgi:chromate transport protein ChrA
MFNKFKKSELFILAVVIILIFISEYYYLVQENFQKAIFIGLWPPTIVGLLIFFNLKLKK